MTAEWRRVQISEVCDLIVDCVNKTAPRVDYKTPYKMIRTPNIKEGRVDLTGCRFVEKKIYEQWTRRAKVLRGDVLLTREAPMGQVGYVDFDDTVFLGQRIMQYRVNEELLDSEYLLYAFLSPDLQHQFHMHEGSGSVVSHIRVPDCLKFELTLPPLKMQKKIANILRGLDKKIELNRQTNQTLEQIAQAIFKSWFVDFEPTRAKIIAKAQGADPATQELAAQAIICGAITLEQLAELEETLSTSLPAAINEKLSQQSSTPISTEQLIATAALFPNELIESELGEVPEGWEVKALSEIIEIIGGGTPKRSEELYWSGEIPWFSVKDAPNLSDVFVVDTIEKITDLGLQKSSTKLLPVGTTIITARGTVGKLALVGTPMCMNQSCYGVRGIRGIGPYFSYFNLRQAIDTLQRNTHGAVFDTITTKTFESYSMPVSSIELMQNYESLVEPLLNKIKINCRQFTALSEFRDTLLPKLLSGELTLEAVE